MIYKTQKTKKRALIALASGVIAATLIMIPANLIITPLFMGVPVDAVKDMILPIIVPFNIVKSGINAIITFIVYKAVSKFIKNGETN